MIPVFTDGDTRNAIVFNSTPSITLNDPTDDADDTYLVEDITVDPMFDAMVDPLPDRDGVQSHEPRRVQTMITIRGWVKAASHAALYDKIRAINRAFDPVLAYLGDTSDIDKGFVGLDFSIPTADTANYPSGSISARYYATPIKRPVPLMTKFDGLSARFVVQLRCADPRMYLQSLTTTTSTPAASPVTLAVTDTTKNLYPVYPIFEVDFITAPSGLMSIHRSLPTLSGALYLSHSALAGNKTLIIDSQAKTVEYSDGTDKIAALTSSSVFPGILPAAANSYVFTGFPSDATFRVIYRRALL